MAMKTIVDNFYGVWVYSGFCNLPFDVVPEVLQCDELVVHSELGIFLAIIRWIFVAARRAAGPQVEAERVPAQTITA